MVSTPAFDPPPVLGPRVVKEDTNWISVTIPLPKLLVRGWTPFLKALTEAANRP